MEVSRTTSSSLEPPSKTFKKKKSIEKPTEKPIEKPDASIPTSSTHSSPTLQPRIPGRPQRQMTWTEGVSSLQTFAIISKQRQRARSKSYLRTVKNIVAHIRLNVVINDGPEHATPGDALSKFTVTLKRDCTVNELARLIEAEYAFAAAATAQEHEKSLAALTKRSKKDSRPKPLVCGQLLSGNVALKFEEKVGDLLAMDDTVKVINIYQESDGEPEGGDEDASGEDINSAETPVDLMSSVVNDAKFPINEWKNINSKSPVLKASSVSSTGAITPPGSTSPVTNPRVVTLKIQKRTSSLQAKSAEDSSRAAAVPYVFSDKKREAIDKAKKEFMTYLDERKTNFGLFLRNKLGLDLFQKHCAREYTLENLLFYLDVEVFKFVHETYSKNPPQFSKLLRSATGANKNHIEVYAAYIQATYISTDGPLQVNLTEEVREEVQTAKISLDMFDEAQEAVFTLMKCHSFPAFMHCEFGKQWIDLITKEKQLVVGMDTHVSFGEIFPPKYDLLILPLDPKKTATTTKNAALGGIDDFEDLSFHKFREGALSKALSRFPFESFTSPVMANKSTSGGNLTASEKNLLENYIRRQAEASLTATQKQRTIQSSRKLHKFFGSNPDGTNALRLPALDDQYSSEFNEDLFSQIKMLNADANLSDDDLLDSDKEDENDDEVDSSGDPQSPDQANGSEKRISLSDGLLRVDAAQRALSIKKKKADKLQTFFGRKYHSPLEEKDGARSVPPTVLEEYPPPILTHNSLTPAARREVRDRHDKLKAVFGEQIDEGTVHKAIVTPVLNRKNEDAGPLSAVESESAASVHDDSILLDDDKDERESKRKKVEKIYSLVGARVKSDFISDTIAEKQLGMEIDGFKAFQVQGNSALGSANDSGKPKQLYLKKTDKLERVFGSFPPPESLPSPKTDSSDFVLNELQSLKLEQLDDSTMTSLLSYLEEDADVEEKGDTFDGDDIDTFATKQRQTIRLRKLKKFLGHETEPSSPKSRKGSGSQQQENIFKWIRRLSEDKNGGGSGKAD